MTKNSITRLNAGGLAAAFVKTKSGVRLYSLRDKKQKKNLLTHESPLFYLTLRKISDGSEKIIASDGGFSQCAIIKQDDLMVISLCGCAELAGVSVTLTAVASQDKISWSVGLQSENEEYSLLKCDYPIISFDVNKNTEIFSPEVCGELINSTKEWSACKNYPSYGASMQYLAFFNKATKRGIYCGIHDPSPAYKQVCIQKKKDEKKASIYLSMPLCDIDMPKNSQSMAGVCVWQIFDGDWYDAALIYRDYVTANAVWMPQTDENGRKDIPEWFRKNSHWWRFRMKEDDSFAEILKEASDDLGDNSPVHMYDWFKIPYDNDYPHYFPVKDDLIKGVRRLQQNGNRVMPYINGRLWDTRDRGMEDWMWSKEGKPNCTKTRGGEPFIETYSSKESDGSSVRLSIMCPSTALWQEKVTEIVSKLLNECKFDAVYIDQIAAAQPYQCEDRTHPHRAGGGTWWIESYNNLLEHVNRIMPNDTVLTTECTSDPYMKHMQGYLSWLWVRNNQVPAFCVVYAGLVTVFGRNYGYLPEDDHNGQRILIAQALTFGEQLGWIPPDIYMGMKYRAFYRSCVQARKATGDFFYDGKILRSPEISDTHAHLYTDKDREAYGGILEHTAFFSEIWERKDGKKLLLLINGGENENVCTVKTDLIEGKFAVGGDYQGEIEFVGGKATITLPPLSVSYAVI